ncbi:MAG TPA: phytoene/squalene synthase family protein [Jatrophihabitans sp.]|jgi:phytoene synthase|uniref:phytoene/squalene synthase family protein n=1 Tax=Jatrophihabitans sp. TaxID=1932789 RepID=UPI002EF077C1
MITNRSKENYRTSPQEHPATGRPAGAPQQQPAMAAPLRPSRGARRELRAAGILEPRAQAGYLQARTLNAQHGRTYYLATQLLPAAKRPYVHALYGFARYADDIVDDLDPRLTAAERAGRFDAWTQAFLTDLERGASADPLCDAVLDTIARWQIPREHFADFLNSMRMDLVVTEYQTFADLRRYMWGSAAVIGLQMLPILGRGDERTGWDGLRQPAIDLGLAFQLTNFLRDVAEDLDRGRIYLPLESLDRFGVDRAALRRARITGTACEPIRRLIAFELGRARELYRSARPGIDLVQRTSRDCLLTAWTLYGAILDEIEKAQYNVFSRRVSVGLGRRASVAGTGLMRAAWTRCPANRR